MIQVVHSIKPAVATDISNAVYYVPPMYAIALLLGGEVIEADLIDIQIRGVLPG